MRIYIEAFILYTVLFLSGSIISIVSGTGETAGFSAGAELTRIFIYSIPSLALIWYLLLRVKPARRWGIMPGKKDLISGLITYPCLLATGIVIALISSYINGSSAQVSIHSPSTVTGWVIICFSCIIAAYLEESFFRFYLLSRKNELKLGAVPVFAISVALFSICHIYGGPWAFLNAVISGAVLAFIFLRYEAIHGIAIAHGLYNITVYVINTILMNYP